MNDEPHKFSGVLCHGHLAHAGRHEQGANGTRRAFTLLEMLLATALATVLMAAVLMVLSAVSRDRQRLTKMDQAAPRPAIIGCLRWDLCNAQTITAAADGRSLILVGHGALDSATLRPTGRLARVTYRAADNSKSFHLIREQSLLDDPARPDRWRELVASGISGLWVIQTGGSLLNITSNQTEMPSRVRIRVETTADAIDETLWIK